MTEFWHSNATRFFSLFANYMAHTKKSHSDSSPNISPNDQPTDNSIQLVFSCDSAGSEDLETTRPAQDLSSSP